MPCMAASPMAMNSSSSRPSSAQRAMDVAVDAAREGALAEALAQRLELHAGQVLVGAHERRGRDEAAQLIGGEQGDVERRLGGDAGGRVVGARRRGPPPRAAPSCAQRLGGLAAVPRDVALGLFGVEVVGEAGEAPEVRVLAEPLGERRA